MGLQEIAFRKGPAPTGLCCLPAAADLTIHAREKRDKGSLRAVPGGLRRSPVTACLGSCFPQRVARLHLCLPRVSLIKLASISLLFSPLFSPPLFPTFSCADADSRPGLAGSSLAGSGPVRPGQAGIRSRSVRYQPRVEYSRGHDEDFSTLSFKVYFFYLLNFRRDV